MTLHLLPSLLLGLCSVALVLCVGCAAETAPDPETMQKNASKQMDPLVLHEYFAGTHTGYGVILSRGGDVMRSFSCTFQGEWPSPDAGVLKEVFTFDDGEVLNREWQFKRTGDNTYSGTAADVVGTATLAIHHNFLQMHYTLEIPYSGRTIHVQADDKLWLMQDGVMLNRSGLSKWGFHVGEIVVSIHKDG